MSFWSIYDFLKKCMKQRFEKSKRFWTWTIFHLKTLFTPGLRLGFAHNWWNPMPSDKRHETKTFLISFVFFFFIIFCVYYILQSQSLIWSKKMLTTIFSGSWQAIAAMHNVDNTMGPNRDGTAATKQLECSNLYFNSTAVSVPWQDCKIWVILWFEHFHTHFCCFYILI